MTETLTGWAVAIKRKDGTKFFASGAQGWAFYHNYADAIAYKKELAEHDLSSRVVKATLKITTEK